MDLPPRPPGTGTAIARPAAPAALAQPWPPPPVVIPRGRPRQDASGAGEPVEADWSFDEGEVSPPSRPGPVAARPVLEPPAPVRPAPSPVRPAPEPPAPPLRQRAPQPLSEADTLPPPGSLLQAPTVSEDQVLDEGEPLPTEPVAVDPGGQEIAQAFDGASSSEKPLRAEPSGRPLRPSEPSRAPRGAGGPAATDGLGRARTRASGPPSAPAALEDAERTGEHRPSRRAAAAASSERLGAGGGILVFVPEAPVEEVPIGGEPAPSRPQRTVAELAPVTRRPSSQTRGPRSALRTEDQGAPSRLRVVLVVGSLVVLAAGGLIAFFILR